MKRKNRVKVVLSMLAIVSNAVPASAAEGVLGAIVAAPVPPQQQTPAPAPSASPAPAAVNTSQAQQDGVNDGINDGGQEGRERGNVDGGVQGKQQGYRDGFEDCERQARQAAADAGYTDGYRFGGNSGNAEGLTHGRADGQARGDQDGRNDGLTRADNDSARDSAGPGQAKGVDQANHSDAASRGYADGLVAGDQQALAKAQNEDYPRGRQTYRQERENEAVQNHDDFSQRPSSSSSALRMNLLSKKGLGGISNGLRLMDGDGNKTPTANPDFRYAHPRRTYATQEENNAYQSSYRAGYTTGMQREYAASFETEYDEAARDSRAQGCEDARHRDYRGDYNQGFESGRQKGFAQAYQLAYDQSYHDAYNAIFPQSSQAAYQGAYSADYAKHFEEARAAAYAARTGQLYDDAHEKGRQEKFGQMYPQYAQQQYANGRADEAQDFAQRPVRLLMAEATETNGNGVFEPSEALRVHVQLRNYGGSPINAKDVKLTITAYDDSSAVITQGEALLVRNLNQKSVTDVREALEFRMNENAANRTTRFHVTATYQGRNVGEQDIGVNTQFMIKVEFAEAPQVKDGIATPMKVKLTNISKLASDPQLRVSLLADAQKLEIANAEQVVPGLAAGESRVVEYTVTAHTPDQTLELPIAISVNSTRRIGLLDQTAEVPVVNDYHVSLNVRADALQKAGIARMYYQVQNTGSRLLYRALQLKVSIKNTDHPENFVILGPNPQFLMPLEQGESVQFVVPVLVQANNPGAMLEMTLMEDGKVVVIHDEDFRTQALN